MSIPYKPTADMLEVLAEVERNSRSILLRPPITLGAPPTYDEPVTGREPFMTSAERKLVRGYREEVETYLYYRGVDSLTSTQWGRSCLVVEDTCAATLATQKANSTRASGLLAAWERVNPGGQTMESAATEHRALLLFEAASRLIPRDSTRVSIGCAQLENQQMHNAQRSFLKVLSKHNSVAKPFAAENMGLAMWQTRKYLQAAEYYRKASNSLDWTLERAVSCLVSAAFSNQWGVVRGSTQGIVERGFHTEHPDVKRVMALLAGTKNSTALDGTKHVLCMSSPPSLDSLALAFLRPYLVQK